MKNWRANPHYRKYVLDEEESPRDAESDDGRDADIEGSSPPCNEAIVEVNRWSVTLVVRGGMNPKAGAVEMTVVPNVDLITHQTLCLGPGPDATPVRDVTRDDTEKRGRGADRSSDRRSHHSRSSSSSSTSSSRSRHRRSRGRGRNHRNGRRDHHHSRSKTNKHRAPLPRTHPRKAKSPGRLEKLVSSLSNPPTSLLTVIVIHQLYVRKFITEVACLERAEDAPLQPTAPQFDIIGMQNHDDGYPRPVYEEGTTLRVDFTSGPQSDWNQQLYGVLAEEPSVVGGGMRSCSPRSPSIIGRSSSSPD